MKLYSIYESILKEQAEILEFPNDNFLISNIWNGKKMMFSPMQATASTGINDYLQMLQQRFLISKINDFGDGKFEVIFDPREDFNAAVDFLRSESERDKE